MVRELVASMGLTMVLVFGLLFALLASLGLYFNIGMYKVNLLNQLTLAKVNTEIWLGIQKGTD